MSESVEIKIDKPKKITFSKEGFKDIEKIYAPTVNKAYIHNINTGKSRDYYNYTDGLFCQKLSINSNITDAVTFMGDTNGVQYFYNGQSVSASTTDILSDYIINGRTLGSNVLYPNVDNLEIFASKADSYAVFKISDNKISKNLYIDTVIKNETDANNNSINTKCIKTNLTVKNSKFCTTQAVNYGNENTEISWLGDGSYINIIASDNYETASNEYHLTVNFNNTAFSSNNNSYVLDSENSSIIIINDNNKGILYSIELEPLDDSSVLITHNVTIDSLTNAIHIRDLKNDIENKIIFINNDDNTYEVSPDSGNIEIINDQKSYKLYEVANSYDMSYSTDRKDFSSDEVFANARKLPYNINAYRGASPFGNTMGRTEYASNYIKKHTDIGYIFDLTDVTVSDIQNKTGIISDSIVAVSLPYDKSFTDTTNFMKPLGDGIKRLIETWHKGDSSKAVYIHCNEGKYRAGFVCCLFECLMNIGYDFIISDYAQSYINYYGIINGTTEYNNLIMPNFGMLDTIRNYGTSRDLSIRNCYDGAVKYLNGCGLEDVDISHLRLLLSGNNWIDTSENS